MAGKPTLEQILQRKQQFAETAKQPPVNQLASAVGVAPPSSAFGAGLIPGTTSDQAKMMGTPAQKGAAQKMAALGGETALEQAAKLRAPVEATLEEETKKRKAAALSQGLGTFGDKATELIETTFQTITGQKVQGTPTPEGAAAPKPEDVLTLKMDTAAVKLAGKTPTQIAAIQALVNSIATMPAGEARNQATLDLNAELGLTGATALTPDEVKPLLTKVEEVVKTAAGAGVTRTVGDKITLSDLTRIGTDIGEVASLLNLPPETVAEMTFGDLQNALATIGQQTFGEVQAVQAGMATGLLSPTERAALRDVLATMEETGIAGAEYQVGQIGKDIADGTQVTVGGQVFSIEELLAAEQMTDIVKDVLADPKSKFSLALQKDSPDLYNWILKSRDGLTALISGAETGVKEFKTVQEANMALVKPLLPFKDYFSKMVGTDGKPLFDLTALRTGALKLGDLPASAQLVLNTPPEKQSTVLSNLTQLPAAEVQALEPGDLAKLGLDNPTGLWSRYVAEIANRKRIANIPTEQPQVIFDTLGWGSIDNANKVLADAMLVEAMGGPKHPWLDIDVNDNGKIDAVDMENLKKLAAGGQLPSLKDIATSGQVPVVSLTNPTSSPLDYGNPVIKQIVSVMSDGQVSPQEAGVIASTPATEIDALLSVLQTGIMSKPGADSLRSAVEALVNNNTNQALSDSGIDQNILNINSRPIYVDEAQSSIAVLNGAIDRLSQRISQTPSQAVRQKLEETVNGLRNKKAQLESGFEGVSIYTLRPGESSGGKSQAPTLPEVKTGGDLFNIPVGKVVSEKAGSVVKTLRKLR